MHTRARELLLLYCADTPASLESPPFNSCLFTFHLNAGGLGWVAARRSAEVSTEDIAFSCLHCNLLVSTSCVSLAPARIVAWRLCLLVLERGVRSQF